MRVRGRYHCQVVQRVTVDVVKVMFSMGVMCWERVQHVLIGMM